MTRATNSQVRRRRHKKILKQTKGHQGGRHSLYRQANESMLHALSYSFAHRRKLKGDRRRQWNIRINAAARENGVSYSVLINCLKKSGAEIDRKMLADLAIQDPLAFTQIVNEATKQLQPA